MYAFKCYPLIVQNEILSKTLEGLKDSHSKLLQQFTENNMALQQVYMATQNLVTHLGKIKERSV